MNRLTPTTADANHALDSLTTFEYEAVNVRLESLGCPGPTATAEETPEIIGEVLIDLRAEGIVPRRCMHGRTFDDMCERCHAG